MKVGIVDSGMGNLASVKRATEEYISEVLIAKKPQDLFSCSHVILPGVGSFDRAMENLESLGFVEALNDLILKNKIPFLGICLGMQILAEKGFEGRETKGLGWIKGEARKLSGNDPLPHIGWNEVNFLKPSPLFRGIESGKDFYFIHSYHLDCPKEDAIAETPYCSGFVSAVQKGNIFGVQFHPEKSQRLGLRVLSNFLC